MDGLFVIDKPSGCTSHDVVARVRKIFGIRRVGHGGTLDPDATGVLLVAVGRATRFFPFLAAESKSYEGVIRLGYSTDTYDAGGRPTSMESSDFPSPGALRAAMKSFEGQSSQLPPPYSAKKVGGRPMYALARAGREFDRKPSTVLIKSFKLRDYRPPFVGFEVECSAGTYVRSLAHDLGAGLGCGAHLLKLRRTSVGPYTLAGASDLAGLEAAAAVPPHPPRTAAARSARRVGPSRGPRKAPQRGPARAPRSRAWLRGAPSGVSLPGPGRLGQAGGPGQVIRRRAQAPARPRRPLGAPVPARYQDVCPPGRGPFNPSAALLSNGGVSLNFARIYCIVVRL